MRRFAAGLLTVATLTGCASRAVDAAPPSTTPPPAVSPVAEVYAAAVAAAPAGSTVYLRDVICPDVTRQPPGDSCAGTPLATGLVAELTRRLGPARALHLLGPGESPPGGEPHAPTVVTLGPAHVAATAATAQLAYECGPLCGAGTTYQLARRADGWHVTGQTGPGWIS